MDKEPIITVAMVTAFVSGVLGLVTAFGFVVTQAQQDSVLKLTAAICALIIGMGFFGRRFVYSEETHDTNVTNAYLDGIDEGLAQVAPTPAPVVFQPVAPVVTPAPVVVATDDATVTIPANGAGNGDDTTAVDADVVTLGPPVPESVPSPIVVAKS